MAKSSRIHVPEDSEVADREEGSFQSMLNYESLDEAFPAVDPGASGVFGSRVLIQLKLPKTKTKGGVVLVHDTQDTEKWNTQVAKVIFIGPVAFRNRDTQQPWPEGDWAKPGDYVRVPKYGGDRWEVSRPGTTDMVTFVVFNDLDLSAPVPADKVLDFIAHI